MSPSAMPTRSNAGVINMDTKAMHADVAAYKRLRKDGTQPKSVKGAAALESVLYRSGRLKQEQRSRVTPSWAND